jgi:transcription elongation factor GreA
VYAAPIIKGYGFYLISENTCFPITREDPSAAMPRALAHWYFVFGACCLSAPPDALAPLAERQENKMSGQRIPMLREGFQSMEVELKRLKHEERPAVVEAIEEARAHGDLSENAEYHAAKERQGMIEARVNELEDKMSRAEVIDPTRLSGDRAVFGATVTLIDEDDKKVTYQIVGADEADVSKGRISFTSPIGRALIGKSTGDEVEVITPGGEKYYDIEAVQFK